MSRVQRWDFAPVSVEDLAPAKRTAEGYLELEVRAARIGRQDYDTGPEMREPEDVFAPESLATWERRPLTNTHPAELLTPETARAHAVGAISSPRRKGDWVVVNALVHDAKTIEDLYAGRVQVSAGYSARLEPGADGMPRQRDIQINHLSFVDQPRAGAGARARLDGSTTITTRAAGARNRKDTPMERKMKIGDAEYDLGTDDGFKSFVKAKNEQDDKLDQVQAQLDAATEPKDCPACSDGDDDEEPDTEEEDRADADEEKCDLCDGKGKVPGMVADWHTRDRGDDLDVGGAELENDRQLEENAGKVTKENSDAQLERLAELLVVARQHLGADFKFDGRKPHEVRKLVVEKLIGRKLDGKSRGYVRARFDAELERQPEPLSAADQLRAGAAPWAPGTRTDNAPRLRGQALMLQRLRELNGSRADSAVLEAAAQQMQQVGAGLRGRPTAIALPPIAPRADGLSGRDAMLKNQRDQADGKHVDQVDEGSLAARSRQSAAAGKKRGRR